MLITRNGEPALETRPAWVAALLRCQSLRLLFSSRTYVYLVPFGETVKSPSLYEAFAHE